MNKIAKIISVVLSVSLVIGVSVAMLVSAFAAGTPKFSISVASETDSEVVLELSLDEGSLNAFDVQVNAKDWNSTDARTTGLTLTGIKRVGSFLAFFTPSDDGDESAAPMFASKKETGKVSFACVGTYEATGAMLTFTFSKTNADKVAPSDFIAVVSSCTDGEGNTITDASVTNNIPVPEKPVVSEPSSEDVSEPSSEATEPSSEDASSDEKSTVAPVVDSTVDGSASSDVVNPKTGDRLTATAAVISLLAISGAAVVALRKKED